METAVAVGGNAACRMPGQAMVGLYIHLAMKGLESPSLDTIMVYSKTITINFMMCMKRWDNSYTFTLCMQCGKESFQIPSVTHSEPHPTMDRNKMQAILSVHI